MLVGKLTYDTVKQRHKSSGELSPKYFPSDYMSSKNNNINERPLKSNLNELSFKGLSFTGENKPAKKEDKMKPLYATLGVLAATGLAMRLAPSYKKAGEYSIREFREFAKKHIGDNIGENLFDHITKLTNNEEIKKAQPELAKLVNNMVKIDGDKITLYKKTIPQLIWDGLKYPFTILPKDIVNGSVALLGKIKPLKKWSEKTLAKPFFKNVRQNSKIDAQMNSLRGLFEFRANELDKLVKAKKVKLNTDNLDTTAMQEVRAELDAAMNAKVFPQSVKMFDPKTGNYDTKHERSLNRLVSGLPPAIFLANDAYNLSRMMDDDKTSASHEQKVRFRQEMARIGFNAYITLITLGALNKYINNSKMGIMIMTALTTLTTEAFSRVINGKHITRLTPEEARAENLKNHAPESEIKPDLSFKASKDKKEEEKQQEPLLSFNTIMKAVAGIIAGGFAVKGLRKIPSVNNLWKNTADYFGKHYAKLTRTENFKISEEKFNQIINVLEDNGFNDMAQQYKNIAKMSVNADGSVSLGAKDKKIKPFVDFFLAPFRFIKKYVILPYKLTENAVNLIVKNKKHLKLDINDEKTLNTIVKNYIKEKNIVNPESLKDFIKNVKNNNVAADAKLSADEKEILAQIKNISALSKSVENIGHVAEKYTDGKISPREFKDYVADNILKSFNEDTMSNLSNSDLSNIAKTAALAATIWFLMTDNYNMVMLKSNGNDVEGAKTKFKERFVQEGSRLFYQTLLIDLFNNTFSKQYHQSLFGMSWITLTNTTLGEWLTRKSVGMPVGMHSRKQLLELEEKQDNAKGFERKYYDFMKRLTGKRSIKTYEVAPQNAPLKSDKNINFTNNSNIFNEIMKG